MGAFLRATVETLRLRLSDVSNMTQLVENFESTSLDEIEEVGSLRTYDFFWIGLC